MKRLLTALIPVALVPLSCFAISLDELKSNPDQYVFVCQNKDSDCYVNINSIKSLRYSPPYYALSTISYGVSYIDKMIFESSFTVYYDHNEGDKYNTRIREKIHQSFSRNLSQSKSSEDFDQRMETAIRMIRGSDDNTGMSTSFDSVNVFDFDGNLISQIPSFSQANVSPNTPTYHQANFIYYKYYNEYFVDRLGVETY